MFKVPKQKYIEVSLEWQEVIRGKNTNKSFKFDRKTAELHLRLMKDNPYVKNPRIITIE